MIQKSKVSAYIILSYKVNINKRERERNDRRRKKERREREGEREGKRESLKRWRRTFTVTILSR